jgi:hypothetical protein
MRLGAEAIRVAARVESKGAAAWQFSRRFFRREFLSIANFLDKNRNRLHNILLNGIPFPLGASRAGEGPGLFETLRPQPATRAGASKGFFLFPSPVTH